MCGSENERSKDSYLEPAEPVAFEAKVRRSLFIGNLFPCRDAADVRAIIARVEGEHKNANHNCRAYVLGPDAEVVYGSDDGEPAGTAGKPILAAIRRSGITNVMVVVTRYFGGIKLGVRGLIEAYGNVAAEVLSRANPVEKIRSRRLAICLPYAIIGDVAHVLNAGGVVGVPEWVYGEKVKVSAEIRLSATARITDLLDELQAREKICSWKWVVFNQPL
ncbi:MAG: YigZ family protein [Synergistaceae bacterium]|jgi:uncharacterized YigZ family protein|nr:YigZ family protein [Synergistaceae bacterium]